MISPDIKMGLLHKLIANPEIDTTALSAYFNHAFFPNCPLLPPVTYESLARLCCLLTSFCKQNTKGSGLAKVTRELLCFLEEETSSTNTLQMPSDYLDPLIYHG